MRDDDPYETEAEIALDRQIGAVARRVRVRRELIVTDAERLRDNLNDRLRSPGAVLTAIGVGVALEQSRRRRHWSLLNVLNVINACLALRASFRTHGHEPAIRGDERSVP